MIAPAFYAKILISIGMGSFYIKKVEAIAIKNDEEYLYRFTTMEKLGQKCILSDHFFFISA